MSGGPSSLSHHLALTCSSSEKGSYYLQLSLLIMVSSGQNQYPGSPQLSWVGVQQSPLTGSWSLQDSTHSGGSPPAQVSSLHVEALCDDAGQFQEPSVHLGCLLTSPVQLTTHMGISLSSQLSSVPLLSEPQPTSPTDATPANKPITKSIFGYLNIKASLRVIPIVFQMPTV
jgi:hypothetical protein